MTDHNCRTCKHAVWDRTPSGRYAKTGWCMAKVELPRMPASWVASRWLVDAWGAIREANADGVEISRKNPCAGCGLWEVK